MTRIFRVADENGAPDWFGAQENSSFEGFLSAEEADRIINLPEALEGDSVFDEMDSIEKCASDGSMYYYSTKWSNRSVSMLEEFAKASGCKTKGVDPSDEKLHSFASGPSKETQQAFQKVASTISPMVSADERSANTLDIGDAFKLDEKGNDDHLAPSDWEKVSEAKHIGSPDVVVMTGSSVLRLNADIETEDYSINPHLAMKPGQNSVTNPDAIGKMISSETEDTGARLKREKAERETAKESSRQMADKELVQKMKQADSAQPGVHGAVKKGNVFLTEAMDAQPGIRDGSSQLGITVDQAAALPEFTLGETLKDRNETRRASIQRTREDDQDWDQLKSQAEHVISEDLSKALEEHFKDSGKE